MKKSTFNIFKYVGVVIVYAVVIWKFFDYKDCVSFFEEGFEFTGMAVVFLFVLLLLAPLNVMLESMKWRVLVSGVCEMSMKDATKSVLVGFVGGVVTPNRLGDFPMRTLYMPKDTKVAGVTVGFLGSAVQTVVMSVVGLVSLVVMIWRDYFDMPNAMQYSAFVLGIVVLILVLMLFLPSFSQMVLDKIAKSAYIVNVFKALMAVKFAQFCKILLITILRYIVFSFQFYIALQLFGVELSIQQALLAIPAMYLLVTITPSIVLTDLIVRTSYAVMIVGVFSDSVLAISMASFVVWVVNCILPLLFGTVLFCSSDVKS